MPNGRVWGLGFRGLGYRVYVGLRVLGIGVKGY